MHYAGLKLRFGALVIDFVIFCLVFFPITRIVKGVWIMSPSDHQWVSGLIITDPLCLIFLFVMAAYFIFLEGLAGITIGKLVFRLRVVRIDGAEPGLWKGAVRNVLRIIDGLPAFCLLGMILIMQSPERARYGDRIAGTRVIRTRSRA